MYRAASAMVLGILFALACTSAECSASAAKDDMKWWQDTICYEIYPASFRDSNGDGTGDIKGITSSLDYIASLGVGAIWLTPVYASPMVDNGYDISDYYDIDPLFGSMDDMDELIREADRRGIKIVMDLVFNHTSDRHKWFVSSCADRDGDWGDWYIWADAKPDGSAPNNWRSIFGGSAWEWNEQRGQYYLHTFAREQPDLNWESENVRNALYDIAKFWLGKGVGGFRVDAVTYIKKPSGMPDCQSDSADGTADIHAATANTGGIIDFIKEFARNVSEGRDIFTVAEANGVSSSELPHWVGSMGAFDMLFEFSHVTVGFEESQNWSMYGGYALPDLKRAINSSQAATADYGWYPIFLENHDIPRCVDRYFPADADKALAAKAAAVMMLTLRGTPFIYQGQELGMTNVKKSSIAEFDDIRSKGEYEFARANGASEAEAMDAVNSFSRDNARTPMQWSGAANAGFTSGRPWMAVNPNYADINAEKEDADPDSVLNFYRRLAAVRRDEPLFTHGRYEGIMDDDEKIFAYRRTLADSTAVILINMSNGPVEYDAALVSGAELLASTIVSGAKGPEAGTLRPLEAAIYVKR